MTSYAKEVAAGTRFEFGKNWQRFIEQLDDSRIQAAEESLKRMLGINDLSGRSFLDVLTDRVGTWNMRQTFTPTVSLAPGPLLSCRKESFLRGTNSTVWRVLRRASIGRPRLLSQAW